MPRISLEKVALEHESVNSDARHQNVVVEQGARIGSPSRIPRRFLFDLFFPPCFFCFLLCFFFPSDGRKSSETNGDTRAIESLERSKTSASSRSATRIQRVMTLRLSFSQTVGVCGRVPRPLLYEVSERQHGPGRLAHAEVLRRRAENKSV